MRKKLVSNSPYFKESKKKQKDILRKRMLVTTSLFLLAFIALSLLSRWSKLNIKGVEVSGNNVIDASAIEDAVNKDIAGHYIFVFPRSNFLIYPKSRIEHDLADQFKILKNISITLKGVNTLSVSFAEREGKYTWCGADLPLPTNSEEQCYFMDDSGYIFGEAPYFSGDVYLKFYGVAGTDSPLGVSFASNLFPKLISFRDALKNIGIKTTAYLLKPDDSVELYLASPVPFPDKPKIIFNSDFDVDKAAENIQTALSTDPLKTDFTKKFGALQYIDLRYGNKVYYKFK